MTISMHGPVAERRAEGSSKPPLWTIPYDRYLDKVLGGWIGKSIGGTIGARFEGRKEWIEVQPDALFPDEVPPNDDLDLQVLWLKVLEEKGAWISSDDMAQAWLDYCWYPFCEYGILRRNWRLGVRPPMSGRFGNQFWETGMGCPIRSEIWGYVFPGRPDVAAHYAWLDGTLDHTEQSVGAEQMFSAMASMAFQESDVRKLIDTYIHYLPSNTAIERVVRIAIDAFDEGLTLFESRQRLYALNGIPEACDSRINVPITILALLYGRGDFEESLLAALHCGYDVDCTMATVGALIGQILGASAIPMSFREPVGDKLVMGIAYHRDEMTISGLARDTARMGVLLSAGTSVEISGAPPMAPLPATAVPPKTRIVVNYAGLPCVGPGETCSVSVRLEGRVPETVLGLEAPEGWTVVPASAPVGADRAETTFQLTAPQRPNRWPMRNLFTARLQGHEDVDHRFGVVGAGVWYLLGVHYHLDPPEDVADKKQRAWHHFFASIDRDYLPEPALDVKALHASCSRILGREAVLYAYENEIDLNRLLGMAGPCCAYLARTVVAAEDHATHIVIGNSDGFRIYLNGTLVGERDEHTTWTPQNNSYLVRLKQGENHILLKLIKQDSPDWRFTLGFRPDRGYRRELGQHFVDWDVDLVDGPL